MPFFAVFKDQTDRYSAIEIAQRGQRIHYRETNALVNAAQGWPADREPSNWILIKAGNAYNAVLNARTFEPVTSEEEYALGINSLAMRRLLGPARPTQTTQVAATDDPRPRTHLEPV